MFVKCSADQMKGLQEEDLLISGVHQAHTPEQGPRGPEGRYMGPPEHLLPTQPPEGPKPHWGVGRARLVLSCTGHGHQWQVA